MSMRDELPKHLLRLRRYAVALSRGRIDPNDLIHDTVVRALEKENTFLPGTDLRAWLFTVMHSVYVNHVRKAARRYDTIAFDDEVARCAIPAPQPSRVEFIETARALASMPEKMVAVVRLVEIDGMKYEEAAEELGVPVGTVRSTLSRAHARLRELTGRAAA